MLFPAKQGHTKTAARGTAVAVCSDVQKKAYSAASAAAGFTSFM